MGQAHLAAVGVTRKLECHKAQGGDVVGGVGLVEGHHGQGS